MLWLVWFVVLVDLRVVLDDEALGGGGVEEVDHAWIFEW